MHRLLHLLHLLHWLVVAVVLHLRLHLVPTVWQVSWVLLAVHRVFLWQLL